MSADSKYFDMLRIRPKKTLGASEAAQAVQKCQWQGCDKAGTHKAPAGRNHEGQYLYFCLEHVREYNKNFNYFSGLSDEAVAKFQKDALTGHRPTWETSTGSSGAKLHTAAAFSSIRSGSASALHRMGASFVSAAKKRAAASAPQGAQRRLKTLEAKAFATMGLEEDADKKAIKARYKFLVKMHHPDSNGGDRSSEERFREVLQAYNLLKSAGFC